MEQEEKISFGAVESLNDKRTISSADMATAPTVDVECKLLLDYPSVNDLSNQRKVGICTMCGVRMAAEHHFKDGIRLDEYWGYIMGKVKYDDPVFGHFEGSSALTMLKVATNFGIPEQKFCMDYPLKTDGTYKEFWDDFVSTYKGIVPEDIVKNAAKHKIPGYYRLMEDVSQGLIGPTPMLVAKEICAGRIVIARFVVGDNTYSDSKGKYTRKAKDLLPLRAPKNVEGGHIWVLNEYWSGGSQMGGPNSWSRSWCVGNTKQEDGYFWFEFDTQEHYFTEAWAIMDRESKYIFTKDLTLGATGADVVALQKFLVKEKHMVMPPGVAYGYFGELTRQGVIRYQKSKGIKPDVGYFGPITRKAINA